MKIAVERLKLNQFVTTAQTFFKKLQHGTKRNTRDIITKSTTRCPGLSNLQSYFTLLIYLSIAKTKTKSEENEKLKKWINEHGKASQEKAERLQIENESLQHELNAYRLESDAIKSNLLQITEENKTLIDNCKQLTNNKNIISAKLKDTLEQLKKTEESLEAYYQNESRWNELKTENVELKTRNSILITENSNLSHRNLLFESKNYSLINQTNERMQEIKTLTQYEDKYQAELNKLQNENDAALQTINEQNQIIAVLNEKLGLKQDDDTYRPITSSMLKTLRMEQIESSHVKWSDSNIGGAAIEEHRLSLFQALKCRIYFNSDR